MLKEHQIRILMLAHEVEKALADIYMQFLEQFPEHSDLWNTLIREEQSHAEATRKLYQLTYEGQSVFDEGQIKLEAVQWVLNYLKGIEEDARRKKYTAKKAISVTCDIENTIIDRDFYSHFKVSPQYADLLRTLRDESESHARLARQKLDAL